MSNVITSFENILINNVSVSGSAHYLYYLKTLLLNGGWTVLASSDGTTYNSSGDQISSPDAGTNGMNNNGAWFRITDTYSTPSREFIMMRGNTAVNAIIKYSRSSSFSGGSPSATVLPTTADGDGVVLLGINGANSADSAVTGSAHSQSLMTSVSAPARFHFIYGNDQLYADNNLCYPWYSFAVSGSTILCMYSHENIIPIASSSGSYAGGAPYNINNSYNSSRQSIQTTEYKDLDPSWFIIAPTAATLSNIDGTGQTATLSSSPGRTWFKYNLTGSTFERAIGLSYSGITSATTTVLKTFPTSFSTSNPYDGSEFGIPFLVRSVNFPKGFTSGLQWKSRTLNFPDIMTYGDDWYVYLDKLLVPWPSGSLPNTSSIP